MNGYITTLIHILLSMELGTHRMVETWHTNGKITWSCSCKSKLLI